ncbi:MAG: hypothetical protein US70_C0020G0022 [Parcubacteria group bacterium GW2011_GWD2_38_11]|nr:MAG: hypothetical protein US70_C0020G0022 [Parcubacteria group bacterium GW2011_GWD2_38_11]
MFGFGNSFEGQMKIAKGRVSQDMIMGALIVT